MKQYGSKSRSNKAQQAAPHTAATTASSPTAVAKVLSIDASPINTIQRPAKRGRQILKESKAIANSLSSEKKLPRKNVIEGKIECFSNQCYLSVSEHSEMPESLVLAPNIPLLSDVESTEAFHTRSDLNQKYRASFKPKLCTVPAVQQNDFTVDNCCPQQSRIDSKDLNQKNCSNVQTIPVPNIFPTKFSTLNRATQQPESHLTNRQALSQTRSIGIQVDLLPISDMKIMLNFFAVIYCCQNMTFISPCRLASINSAQEVIDRIIAGIFQSKQHQ